MERFYGLSPEEIDIKFAEKRMLWIKEHASFRNLFCRWINPPPKSFRNRQLARPLHGFAELYRDAADRLISDGATLLLGTRVCGLVKEDDLFFLDTGQRVVSADRVISTIPLKHAETMCRMPVTQLQSVTLISLFFSFSGNRGFKQSILYNFAYEGAWKRLTVYSDFYGLVENREFFAVEVNAHLVNNSVEQAVSDFRQHTAKNRLFIGNLHLEGSHMLSNAYPVYTDHASDKAEIAIARLRAFGIETIGRQGTFDYQPTARDSTLKAEVALQRL